MLKINEELRELIPPLSTEEKQLLTESILKEGCRDSLITWNNTIIDGHNRYQICKANNIAFSTKEMDFDNIENVKEWMINNQFSRRNLPLYERARLALKLKPIIEERAKENLKIYTGNQYEDAPYQKSDNIQKINTTKELGKTAGVSHDTIHKVEVIEKKATPEVKQQLSKGDISINQAYKEIKKEEKRNEVIENLKPIELPEGLFDIIYCDPPWKYDFAETENRAIENHYPTMTVEEMKKLDIPAAKNSVMLMWATAPKLEEALDLLKALGFTYKTNAVWDKEIIGMGYWFRGQHEFLLIGTKGNYPPPIAENRFSSVIREKRTKHSKKPLIMYEMIEKMFPNGRYIELFSRNKFNDNWHVWGNQL